MGEGQIPPSRGALPQQIGRYRIRTRIGRGAMGVVYSAVDEQMGRPVALKVLMADLETDPDTRARFYREAQAAARLIHPNVITVFDAGEDQGRSFIAMQLLEGAPLPIYLKRPEAASLERKLDLMIQVCEGLTAAHAEGIIHRDLKPNNLFVQSDGLLKILDFGVARITDSSMTAAGTMLGTPDYMSPEQARGETIDARSDIFSAGSVFYFMLAGHKPFPGPDLPAILRQLQFEQPPPLRSVPPELATLISQAMARNPDHRPARVEQLLADLVRFRKQYLADTRRLAFSLRTQFEELETLGASIRDTSEALGVADPAAEVLAEIRSQHPFLAASGAAIEAIPLDRAALNTVAEMLYARRDELVALLEVHYSCVRRLETGEQALAAGDVSTALASFEAVLADCPDSANAQRFIEMAGPVARDLQQRQQRVAQALAAGREAMIAGDLDTALACARKARTLDPRDEDAAAFTTEVEEAIAREQRRIALAVQRALERADAALEVGDFDAAEAAFAEVEAVQRSAPGLVEGRRRLAAARAAAQAAALLRSLSDDEIRRARGAFRRGRREEAIQQLETFLRAEPQADRVAAELEHLRALHAALTHRAAVSGERTRELIASAAAARDEEMLDEAQALLRQALSVEPANVEASEMLDEVFRRRLDAALARAHAQAHEDRVEAAMPMVQAAQTALDHGYIAVALDAALAAQHVCPDAPGVAAIVEQAQRELGAADEVAFDLRELPDAPEAEEEAPSPEAGMLSWLFRSGLRRRKS